MMKKRVFSGMQPSGNLTIGNYLGALKHWVADQDVYDCFFCIVDMHAITVPQDPIQLRTKTREVAALYIACGLDPQKVTIFAQSHVSEHAELGWMLTCFSPLGWLNRMTQFKDKVAKQQQDSVSAGLLTYPSLMAADILLYHTHYVPVGDDQRQHLEFTRDLAQKFNAAYGDTFTVPEAMIPKAGARIMGLDNPLKKMSKSEDAQGHAVYLLDDPAKIKQKVMRAVTDSYGEIKYAEEEDRAGVRNLLTIIHAFTGESLESSEGRFVGRGYGDLKKEAVEVIVEYLAPVQDRYKQIVAEPGHLDRLLSEGAAAARNIARHTLREVQHRIGFVVLD
jgi:tryptophanyl-tRNA synthetase